MVDGANIAYAEQTEEDKAQVSNLIAVRKETPVLAHTIQARKWFVVGTSVP